MQQVFLVGDVKTVVGEKYDYHAIPLIYLIDGESDRHKKIVHFVFDDSEMFVNILHDGKKLEKIEKFIPEDDAILYCDKDLYEMEKWNEQIQDFCQAILNQMYV